MAVTPQDDSEFNAVEDGEFLETDEGAAPDDDEAVESPEGETTDESEAEGSTEERIRLNVDELGEHYVTVKINGEDVEMPLKEALQATMRQADYTRKTQELSVERERLASIARLAEHLERDPARTIAVLQKTLGVEGAQALIDEAEEIDPIQAKLQAHDEFIESQMQEARNRQIISAAEDTIAATPGLEGAKADELLQFALDNQIMDLGKAARFLANEKRLTPKVDARKDEVVARKRAAAVVEGGRTRAPETVEAKVVRKPTLRQAYEAAKAAQTATR